MIAPLSFWLLLIFPFLLLLVDIGMQCCWKRSFLVYFLISGHINSVQRIGWSSVKKDVQLFHHPMRVLFILHPIVFQ
jgi:hypothetical protein